jgi:CRP-like cAMP-binding protein
MSLKDIFPIDKWESNSQSILAEMPPEDLIALTANQKRQHYAKAEIIFREETYPNGIFFIERGMVKKFKADKDGKEQIIYVANAGELIGYHALLADERFPDSATTLEASIIVFIPKADFLNVLNRSEVLGRRLLKTLSHEFAVLANSLTLFAQRSARERLALRLVILREKYKKDFQPGMAVEINMSREDLASFSGTARENVVRISSDFKDDGILETRGRKIIVQNLQKLIEIANHA